MMNIPPIAALAIARKVRRAVNRAKLQPLAGAGLTMPPVAGRARIEAELRAIGKQLSQLGPRATETTDLEELLDRASSRIAEWSI